MAKYQGYTPAQAKANAEYDKRTYKKLLFRLRVDEDAEIIQSINEAQKGGLNKTEWLRELYEKANKNAGE